ncbi:multiple sugar transport system substrate-binding protein/sorbitol/mannitol transport system substrate-binding protein [Palleronia aestuarii]|uniref:Multiple sugar transport system substrate-binding protein/sorbitol/mannitol transport system substrate-binding protein n=1 Tax=Palleronia aestuarii TaxID=568105 RepID=A0A2W7MTG4_9RHOB|nr:sugar ABC transporter substrate-binding protein [Palleronia aestuarii]PZX11258.1 multiple sugar transport system substrate-binding protein/sorbitol/mannitol transport system substrate-binding protein [Palleronia aestuarii]
MIKTTHGALSAMLLLGSTALAPIAANAQDREVNVLLFSMPSTRGLAALADDFEAETGITANIDVVGQDVFESRITLSFTGGARDIDVVHTPVIQVQRWVEAGWLEPVTDTVEGLEDKDDILSGPLEAYQVNGDYYGLPFFAETGLMAYRKDLLDAAGVEAPETWDEMLEVAKAVDSDETAAIAMRVAPGQGFNMFVFPMLMRAYGGKFFADYPDDMTPALDSPENLEALNTYITLMNDYGPQGIGNFNFPEVVAALQNGQAAMTVDGTSIVSQAVDPAASQFADEFVLALPPGGPAGRSPAIAVHGLGIPAGSENAETAAEFIKWATSTETLTKLAINEAFPDFTRASVAENAEVQAKYAEVQEDFLDLRIEALNLAIGHYRPLIPTWPEIGAAIGENVNAAVNGQMSPEEALEAAQEEMEIILSY